MQEFLLGMVIVLATASLIKGTKRRAAAGVLIVAVAVLFWSLFQEYRPTLADEGAHSYFVAQIEEKSSGEVIRFNWHVIVTTPITGEELRQLAEAVIEEAIQGEDKFNSLTVLFYDYPEYIGALPTAPLGQAVFAPQGNSARAAQVAPGDYRRMETKYSLRHKDWSLQLSLQEVAVWALWNQLYFEQLGFEEDPNEEEITAQVGVEFSLAPGDINAILARQVVWHYDNSGQ
jgi:hypothetical protein